EAGNQIELADILRIPVLLAVLFQIQKTEDVEAVIQTHEDNVAAACQTRAIIRWQPLVRTAGIAAAVNPNQHGALPVVANSGCPDAHRQHVLAGNSVVPVVNETGFIVAPITRRCGTGIGVTSGATDTGPRSRLLPHHPAIEATGVGAVRNAF